MFVLLAYLHLTMAVLKVKFEVIHMSTASSEIMQIWQPLRHFRTLHMAFRLVYLEMTLVSSKGQDQGHAHFDCKYL